MADRFLRSMCALLIAVVVTGVSAAPARAEEKLKQLGLDPALDAPPGADLASLWVGTTGDDLQIRIAMANAIPVQGSYPGAGIEWAFYVEGHTYLAEGHPESGSFRFTLYEVLGDTFRQIESLEGEFDTIAGFMDMYVPLDLIGAHKGTRISGAGPTGTEDVDVHQHAGPASPVLDAMATSRDYIIRK